MGFGPASRTGAEARARRLSMIVKSGLAAMKGRAGHPCDAVSRVLELCRPSPAATPSDLEAGGVTLPPSPRSL